LLSVAALGDLKERGGRGGRGPQRATLTAGPPAGLIDMHRALVQHPVLQLQVRAGERVAGALADMVDRAGREHDAEQIAASSVIPRREIRCRAVNVTTAAWSLGPNADAPIASGNWALVRARQSRQRNWCVRCSVTITLIGGNSAIWWRPNRPPCLRCPTSNRRPHPPHAFG